MKKIIIITITLIITSCVATQTFKSTDLTKEVILEDLNKSQNDLYITANDWMIDAFKSADGVIQFSDKENGTIIGKYLISGYSFVSYGTVLDNRIFAKITIQVKENRSKISIAPETDIITTEYSQIQTVRNSINNLVLSFNNAMINNNTTNW